MRGFFLYIIILSSFLSANENQFGGSYSFANIPTSAFSLSLGNTITSGISLPSSLQQNPANIWSNNKLNADITHFSDPFDAEFSSLFISFGSEKTLKKYRFGLGAIYHEIGEIELYDDEANFISFSSNKNVGGYLGLSRRISNYFLGSSITYLSSNFDNIPDPETSNLSLFKMYYLYSSFGLCIREIELKTFKIALNIATKIPLSSSKGAFTDIGSAVDGSTLGGKITKISEAYFLNQYYYHYKFDYHLDLSFHKQGEYNRNYIRTGLGYSIFYGDYALTLNCGIKDISIGEKYSFDVIKDYNMKYTYGVLIKINRISFSFSGYQSFIPMPAFNSYNGTISIGI